MSNPQLRPALTTDRTTGISGASVAAGANYLGSEIDNGANQDQFADLSITINCSVAPTALRTVEVYFIYNQGGGYEDGGLSVDPTKMSVWALTARAVTGNQIVNAEGIILRPYPLKILVKSELDQTATITVLCKTGNIEIVP